MSWTAVRAGLLTGALAGALVALAATGAGADGGPEAQTAASRTVVLRNDAFTPRRVTIRRGDRVVWRWRDRGRPHNVTSTAFPSSRTRSRGSHAVTFRRAGRFAYRCTLHPGMTGVVVVRR
jgi:plastocyanin